MAKDRTNWQQFEVPDVIKRYWKYALPENSFPAPNLILYEVSNEVSKSYFRALELRHTVAFRAARSEYMMNLIVACLDEAPPMRNHHRQIAANRGLE